MRHMSSLQSWHWAAGGAVRAQPARERHETKIAGRSHRAGSRQNQRARRVGEDGRGIRKRPLTERSRPAPGHLKRRNGGAWSLFVPCAVFDRDGYASKGPRAIRKRLASPWTQSMMCARAGACQNRCVYSTFDAARQSSVEKRARVGSSSQLRV